MAGVAPIETSALRRAYGRLVALAGLSLTVSAGECVALIGANGSGKSTAVRAIAGLLEPTGGTVRVCGRDPHVEPEAEDARAKLALVPDTPLLYDDLTVRQHLELVTLSHGVAGGGAGEGGGALRGGGGGRGRRGAAGGARARRARGLPAARAVARDAPEDAARLRAHPPRRRARARRAGRRARPAVAGAAGRAPARRQGRRYGGAPHHAPDGLRRRARRPRGDARGGRGCRRGPVGGGP